MANLIIPEDINNPLIDFNEQTGILKIEGNWFTDINTGRKITDNIIKWLNDYFKNTYQKTVLNVSLNFFSTSYSKLLLEIFKYLENRLSDKHQIEINRFCKYDDADFIETGEDFKAVLKIPFKLNEYGKL